MYVCLYVYNSPPPPFGVMGVWYCPPPPLWCGGGVVLSGGLERWTIYIYLNIYKYMYVYIYVSC